MTELVIFFSLFELQVKRKQYKWQKIVFTECTDLFERQTFRLAKM